MSAAKIMEPQQQLDTRAIEIAAGVAGKVENMERLIELQIGHVSEAIAVQATALKETNATIKENHTAVLAAIKEQAGVEANKRGSIYAFKDKIGGLLIVAMGGGMIAMAVYIFQHGVK